MALVHGMGAFIAVGDYDVSAYLNQADRSFSAELADGTTFGRRHKGKVPGMGDGSINLQGLYDGATGAIDEIIQAYLDDGIDVPVTVIPDGLVAPIGTRTSQCSGAIGTYDVTTPIGGVVTISVGVGGNLGVFSGVSLLNPHTSYDTATADPATTLTDLGTIPAGPTVITERTHGYVMNWHCFENTLDDTAQWVIEHSSDNVSWASLAGAETDVVAAGTTASGTERVATNGLAVKRYMRARLTSAGVGTSHWAISVARFNIPTT
jgi:hypothetical protein